MPLILRRLQHLLSRCMLWAAEKRRIACFPFPTTDEAHECLAPLPLLLLAALRGGPLAPLLRLLLQNDSLMDVSGRRELYKEVFGLVAVLAGAFLHRCSSAARGPLPSVGASMTAVPLSISPWEFAEGRACRGLLLNAVCRGQRPVSCHGGLLPAGSPDLLPLLLQPADSDLLKGCFPQQAQQARQVQQSPGRPGSAAAAAAGKLGKRPTRGKGRASPAPAAAEPEADGNKAEAGAEGPPAGDTSCLGALQVMAFQPGRGCSRAPLLLACAQASFACLPACLAASHRLCRLLCALRAQALRLQADIFRHNAEELAAEGDEEDLQLVGGVVRGCALCLCSQGLCPWSKGGAVQGRG